MVTVGFLIRFEAKPGKEVEVERGFQGALPVIQQEPATTAWFGFRLRSSRYGVFDVFPDEAGRQAHFSARGEQLRQRGAEQFVEGSFAMNEIDILAAKLPEQKTTETVRVGFLARFEVRPGKEAEVEQGLKRTLLAVQELPQTVGWFAFRLGPSTFGTFDLFADEAGRQVHRSARLPRIQEIASQLFVEGSLVIEEIDILAAKIPE